jgi:prepilin-type N-terminal cleavage/methylation domain-containing protein
MIKFKIIKPSLKNKKAYTLIELSITILIISLLMAGVFSFATGSINNAKSALTKQRMDEIYKSMGTYLMVNKRLPCPASILTSKVNDANYGQEVAVGAGCEGAGVYKSSTNADLFFGGVPIRALNLSSEYAEDGYGNKFNYISFSLTSPLSSFMLFSYVPLSFPFLFSLLLSIFSPYLFQL